jgi:hypothetical protein
MQDGQSHLPMSFLPQRRHFLSFRLRVTGPGFGAYLSLMAFPPVDGCKMKNGDERRPSKAMD